MEILVTIAYVFLVRLVFFDYKLLRFTLAWKFAVFGLYAAAALTEIILLGNVAMRARHKIEYGGENLKITNCKESNYHLHQEYRKGWTL